MPIDPQRRDLHHLAGAAAPIPAPSEAFAGCAEIPVISLITRIELENGVNREPAAANHRRRLLERLLETIRVEMFTPADILAYGAIVYELGYDRRRTLDRLIAAQSISRDARPITRNRRGFERIDGLRLEVWPAP